MNILEQLKDWAERGWSQEDCAQAMGLTYSKFRDFLRVYGAFKWPKTKTIAQRNCVRDRSSAAYKQAVRNMQKAKIEKQEKYTVNGVTGTRRELVEKFSSVSDVTVWRRIQRGWDIERALFTPSQKSNQHSKREAFSFGSGK